MSPRLPLVSGRETVAALERVGYRAVRQKGSHVRMRHPHPAQHKPLTVPMHRELRPGLLRAIVRDAGLTPDEFRELLGR
ncbi:MAG TPA: type II toxin-antitoxin system HicA family toxin [Planctomycetota bacterium]|nr:type II toxin-antitoxin system HicA family toxin [Planctomycetota bacterium]HRR81076.1 type II toxin-antitoxin system HicA family toxin [Planctomycetota bacterium]HRT94338.1 type II toxin-antitoxin system HicA family toxin [Planctomycetota bacterium]